VQDSGAVWDIPGLVGRGGLERWFWAALNNWGAIIRPAQGLWMKWLNWTCGPGLRVSHGANLYLGLARGTLVGF
jgi:hypothetical protein